MCGVKEERTSKSKREAQDSTPKEIERYMFYQSLVQELLVKSAINNGERDLKAKWPDNVFVEKMCIK